MLSPVRPEAVSLWRAQTAEGTLLTGLIRAHANAADQDAMAAWDWTGRPGDLPIQSAANHSCAMDPSEPAAHQPPGERDRRWGWERRAWQTDTARNTSDGQTTAAATTGPGRSPACWRDSDELEQRLCYFYSTAVERVPNPGTADMSKFSGRLRQYRTSLAAPIGSRRLNGRAHWPGPEIFTLMATFGWWGQSDWSSRPEGAINAGAGLKLAAGWPTPSGRRGGSVPAYSAAMSLVLGV